MKDGPRYTHDCDVCKFLGRFDNFDLYACTPKTDSSSYLHSFIARFGNEGDYASMTKGVVENMKKDQTTPPHIIAVIEAYRRSNE